MKKMIGAFALTAALAMGTAPAFAASVSSETEDFSDNGSTEVKAKVEKVVNPQMKATVPLQITVVFGAEGASDILGPSPTAYYIENTGEDDIKVVDAEITGLNSLFTNQAVQLNGQEEAVVGTGNNLMFYLTTENNNCYLTAGHTAAQQTNGSVQNKYFPASQPAIRWSDEELAFGDKMEITIGGKAYFNEKISQDKLTDAICSIMYTIAPIE